MLTRISLGIALLATAPIWAQMAPKPAGPVATTLMQAPPPVSGEGYSMELGTGERSNYLHAGLLFSTAYNDNVLGESSTRPVADSSYSISPTIALDQTTPRLHHMLQYSPGFTFYQHTSSLNQQDQYLHWDLEYRLGPYTTVNVRESLQKSSNIFGQPYSFSQGAVSGSTQSPLTPVYAPVADQLRNTTDVELTHQFSMNGMFGALGDFAILHYLDPAQAAGLADSDSRGGAAFLAYRPGRMQYFGAMYQYSQILGSLPASETNTQSSIGSEIQTHAVLFFFTSYLNSGLSFSISGGPQHYEVTQSPLPGARSWTPAIAASMGWQGRRASLAASYSRLVSGGGGLIGAFNADSATASARWQVARSWTLGSIASYALTKNVTPAIAQMNPGGHMMSGTFNVQQPINQRLQLEFGYTRLHQTYDSIAVISNAPDMNREYVSVSYQFTRPLGR